MIFQMKFCCEFLQLWKYTLKVFIHRNIYLWVYQKWKLSQVILCAVNGVYKGKENCNVEKLTHYA